MTEDNKEINHLNIDAIIQDIASRRTRILEDFARAYLAEFSGLMPSQIEFCFQNDYENGIEKVWIRKLPDDKGSGI
jgi:hypothetical protein